MSRVKTKYIEDNAITNAKLAQIATATFKGRTTAATGNVEDLSATQATALLNSVVGDSGSGGTKGLVPAPGSGDAAAGKFLKADGTFAVPSTGITSVSQDTAPSLGGDLDVNGKAIQGASSPVLLAGQNSVRRAKQATKTQFVEEEYIHSTTLLASQTNTVISALTFAFGTYEGIEVTYKLKLSTSNIARIGTFRVVTNGTDIGIADAWADTGDSGISFSAAINGSNVEISYTSSTNGGTIRMDVKKFLT